MALAGVRLGCPQGAFSQTDQGVTLMTSRLTCQVSDPMRIHATNAKQHLRALTTSLNE
jgi:hypothetical protein